MKKKKNYKSIHVHKYKIAAHIYVCVTNSNG